MQYAKCTGETGQILLSRRNVQVEQHAQVASCKEIVAKHGIDAPQLGRARRRYGEVVVFEQPDVRGPSTRQICLHVVDL